jgi:hypothetical protein
MTKRSGLRKLCAVIVWALCLATAGCGESLVEQDEKVPLNQVPARVMDVAKKQLPEITFETAWKQKGKNGAEDAYEVRGRNDRGKTRDVKISVSGKVLEVD